MNKKKILFGLVVSFLLSTIIGCGGSHRGKGKMNYNKKNTATAYIPSAEFNPIINVYIENSGSMDGYVKGQTEFEHIVYNYLVDLKNLTDSKYLVNSKPSKVIKELNLNYINSQILPQHDDVKDFIDKLEPNSFKAKGGDRGSSDISTMIKEILAETNDSTISIFISDCIFSPGRGKDAGDYLNNQQVGIKECLGNYIFDHPQCAVVGYRCMSEFDGYCYDKNDAGKYYKGSRPFYIWLFGGQGAINRLRIEMQKNNKPLKGVENTFVAFVGEPRVPDSLYAVKIKSGNFDLDKDDPKHSIKNLNADKGGRIRFSVEVNYAPLILSDDYLCNTDHYELSDPKFELVSVERINEFKKYSHILTFETKQVHPSCLEIILKKDTLTWPQQCNDDDGNEITDANADKTFGIKYMIDGIFEAFSSRNYYTKMTININK